MTPPIESGEARDGGSRHAPPHEAPCGCVVQASGHPVGGEGGVCTEDCAGSCTTITVLGARGGSGASTVAAILALFGRVMVPTELVTDDMVLTSAHLGVTTPPGEGGEVLDRLSLTTAPTGERQLTVIDAGQLHQGRLGPRRPRERRVAVLRGPCYLAMRTLHAADIGGVEGVILVVEPGRALTERDVTDVLGTDVIATVPATPALARAIDAGTLAQRVTADRDLRPLRHWLAGQLEPFPAHPTAPTPPAPPHPPMTGTDLPGALCAPGRSRPLLAATSLSRPGQAAPRTAGSDARHVHRHNTDLVE